MYSYRVMPRNAFPGKLSQLRERRGHTYGFYIPHDVAVNRELTSSASKNILQSLFRAPRSVLNLRVLKFSDRERGACRLLAFPGSHRLAMMSENR